MTSILVLDAGPLALLVQRPNVAAADACRRWASAHILAGARLVVPEVADYEVRRELIRLQKREALSQLDAFVADVPGRYLPITTAAMRRAAELWADVRRRGLPTADPKELDGDVILAAQVLTSDLDASSTVVATTNMVHLSSFPPAQLWTSI